MQNMKVDGIRIAKDLASDIRTRLKTSGKKLRLAVIVAGLNGPIRSFVERKRRFGEDVGVTVDVLSVDTLRDTTQDVLEKILHASREYDGILLQLPVPKEYDLDALLRLFPLTHDVDVLGKIAYQQYKEGNLPFDPPVVAAFAEVLHRHSIQLAGQRVLVIGEGRLVGAPAAVWAQRVGGIVQVVDKETQNIDEWIRGADIIISGAGVPGLLHTGNIAPGAVILDAGTSESDGVVKGDADPACAEVASLFTPTPGGIGPITVAKVFENLLVLHELQVRSRTQRKQNNSDFALMSRADSEALVVRRHMQ